MGEIAPYDPNEALPARPRWALIFFAGRILDSGAAVLTGEAIGVFLLILGANLTGSPLRYGILAAGFLAIIIASARVVRNENDARRKDYQLAQKEIQRLKVRIADLEQITPLWFEWEMQPTFCLPPLTEIQEVYIAEGTDGAGEGVRTHKNLHPSEPQVKHSINSFLYCEFTNYESKPLFDIAVTIHVDFRRSLPENPMMYSEQVGPRAGFTFRIEKIDPGLANKHPVLIHCIAGEGILAQVHAPDTCQGARVINGPREQITIGHPKAFPTHAMTGAGERMFHLANEECNWMKQARLRQAQRTSSKQTSTSAADDLMDDLKEVFREDK